MARFAFLMLFAFVSLLGTTLAGGTRHLERDEMTGHIGSTREEILSKRKQRKELFGGRLEEMKEQMGEHQSGRRLLHETDQTRLAQKIRRYERKMEQLNGSFDDRHVQRIIEREEMVNEVHRDRITRRNEL